MLVKFTGLKLWQKIAIAASILILGRLLIFKGFIMEVKAQELKGRDLVSYDNSEIITYNDDFCKTNTISYPEWFEYGFYTNDANNTVGSYGSSNFGSTISNTFKINHMNMLYSAPHNLYLKTSSDTYFTDNLETDKFYSIIYYFSTSKNVKVANSGWFDNDSISFGLNTHKNWNNYEDFLDYSVRWYNPYSSIGHGGNNANLYDNNVGIMIIQFRLRSSTFLNTNEKYDLETIRFSNNYEWEPITENEYKTVNSSVIFSIDPSINTNNTSIVITGIDFLENKDIYVNNVLSPPISGDSTGGNSSYLVDRSSMNLIFGVDLPLLELDTCSGPTDFSCHFGNVLTMLKNTFIVIRNIPQIIANMIEFYINVIIDRARSTIEDIKNWIDNIRQVIQNIKDYIQNALETVFLPDFNNISNKINTTKNNFNDKFPTISSFIDYVNYIKGRYDNLQAQHTINYNGVKFPGTDTYIIPAFTYDFDTIINNTIINPIYQLVRTIIFCLIGLGWFYFIHNLISSIIYNTRVHIDIGE